MRPEFGPSASLFRGGHRRAAVERGPRGFDARRFIECPEFVENPARLLEQLTSRCEVSSGLS